MVMQLTVRTYKKKRTFYSKNKIQRTRQLENANCCAKHKTMPQQTKAEMNNELSKRIEKQAEAITDQN